MSLRLDLEEWPKRPGHARRPLSESSKATLAVVSGPPYSAECFEDAVAELVQLGYGRERARHLIATRMKFPEHEIARLREAAS
jgi:hypothetical protein